MRTWLLVFLSIALTAQEGNPALRRTRLPAQVAQAGKAHHDRPELREAWDRFWFGTPTRAYLDAKAGWARTEFTQPLGRPRAATMASTGTWTNLGPGANSTSANSPDIDSGRISSIVTHPTDPKILYLGTSGGGVFKCVNADLASTTPWTWTPVTDQLPTATSTGNLAIGALAMSPADPEVLYLALGDAFHAEGRGVFKTINGGASWSEATGIGNQTRAYCLLPVSSQIVLMGGNDGLKRSADGGLSYQPVVLGTQVGGAVWSLQAFPNGDLVCSSETAPFQGGAGIWYSTDQGAQWTRATLDATVQALVPGRISLRTTTDNGLAWGIAQMVNADPHPFNWNLAPGLLKTLDAGRTWTYVPAPTGPGGLFQQESGDGGQGGYAHGFAVDPLAPNRVYVGTNLSLNRTQDGGANWIRLAEWVGYQRVYAHADFQATAWSKTGTPTLFIGNDGGLSILRQPGLPDAQVPSGMGSVASNPAFIDNTRNLGLTDLLVSFVGSTAASTPADSRYRISAAIQDNGTRIRQGSGTALQNSLVYDDQIGGDGYGTLIHPLNGDLMLGSYYNLAILRSSNGGISFNSSTSGLPTSGDLPFATRLTQGLGDPTGNTVYTFSFNRVYKSTNFGQSWAPLPATGLDPALLIRNVAAARTDPNRLAIITTGGTGYATTDSGSTWTKFGVFPNSVDGPAWPYNERYLGYVWIDTNEATKIYASSVALDATANHLWRSTDNGATWQPIDRATGGGDNGFPFGVPVHVIQNDPRDSDRLYAGTDFGVYQSSDHGQSWIRMGQNLPRVAVRDLYLAPDGSFMRVATFGRGVWEIQPSLDASLQITPASLTMINGGTQTFTATVQHGMTNAVQWTATVGAMSPSSSSGAQTTSTFTAPLAGTMATVTALSGDAPFPSASATITLVDPATLTLAISPAHGIVVSGQSCHFIGTTNVGEVYWSVPLAVGTMGSATTASGLSNTFISVPGLLASTTATITLRHSLDPSRTTTATVDIKTLNLNGDDAIDLRDMLALAADWGTTRSRSLLSGNATVGEADLAVLLTGL